MVLLRYKRAPRGHIVGYVDSDFSDYAFNDGVRIEFHLARSSGADTQLRAFIGCAMNWLRILTVTRVV
jgi:hypothetical protein